MDRGDIYHARASLENAYTEIVRIRQDHYEPTRENMQAVERALSNLAEVITTMVNAVEIEQESGY